jgi:GH15 family glucan-1,4-alpha-glucosidase
VGAPGVTEGGSPSRIEDYAIIGDTQTAALVAKNGSIDWLCVPRFDSGAVFAALLGTIEHGRWQLAPAGGIRRVERRYRDGTLVLETTFHTDSGAVRIVDCMPIREDSLDVVRVVEGKTGHLVPEESPRSIVNAIRSLFGNAR